MKEEELKVKLPADKIKAAKAKSKETGIPLQVVLRRAIDNFIMTGNVAKLASPKGVRTSSINPERVYRSSAKRRRISGDAQVDALVEGMTDEHEDFE